MCWTFERKQGGSLKSSGRDLGLLNTVIELITAETMIPVNPGHKRVGSIFGPIEDFCLPA